MRYNYLSLMILTHLGLAQAEAQSVNDILPSQRTDSEPVLSEITLPTITVRAKTLPPSAQMVEIKKQNIDTHTLGETVENVSGVHSGSFGPHSSAPIIRGLTGNRVNINEDGTNINGLNAISPSTNILFDPIFSHSIEVNKNNSVIESGGHAIGGTIDIDSGLVSTHIEEKPKNFTIVFKDGSNAPRSQGIKANFNNQDNVSVNFLYSEQKQDGYNIPGYSKAEVCKTDLVRKNENGLGINTVLAASCQVDAQKISEFNPKSRKYIRTDYIDPITLKYTQTYYDYGLSPSDVYTNQRGFMGYGTAENPQYEAGQPETIESIGDIKDITQNYYKKLGNSGLENHRLGISGTYFFDSGYVAATVDHKTSAYGLPGFSLSNLSFSQDYKDNLPVSIDSRQTKYLLQSEVDLPYDWLYQLDVDMAHVNERNDELLGDTIANRYNFDTYSAKVVTHHQSGLDLQKSLSGKLGFELSNRSVEGEGKQRYLPDVVTQKQALFLTESLSLDPITLSAGYRYEHVAHNIKNSDFESSTKSPNYNKLLDKDFNLSSYEVAARLDINSNYALNLRYAESERAPEINELYASQAHYSTMTHEEGNQTLSPEKVASTELSALINYDTFDVTATVYQHDFDGFYSLRPSGTTFLANRLPLKYWKQIDTKVTGFEVDVSKSITFDRYGEFTTHLFADLVKNKPKDNEANGEYLNNIPSDRYGLGLNWKQKGWESELNLVHYAQPKYLGKEINTEVALPSYNMMDLSVARTLNSWSDVDVKVFANASNLLNEEARPHVSPLRFIAPLPERSINAGVTINF